MPCPAAAETSADSLQVADSPPLPASADRWPARRRAPEARASRTARRTTSSRSAMPASAKLLDTRCHRSSACRSCRSALHAHPRVVPATRRGEIALRDEPHCQGAVHTAIGVANPRAQGQEISSTASAAISAVSIPLPPGMKCRSVATATTSTHARTNPKRDRPTADTAPWSAVRSRTNSISRASEPSLTGAETRTSNSPSRFKPPPKTCVARPLGDRPAFAGQ